MSAKTDIQHGKAVLAREIEGLKALEDSLSDGFAKAVDCLANIEGRIIITGMGKSGHVARKIAATMASTGTPAYFVHPGEASHGDLGMITTKDAVLALSNSGETAELSDMIGYAKRFSIPLIGIARRAGSMLVEAADIALVLPEIPEASPVNAPTTSTTMMMALGDAIAVALLERRGFTKDDFSVYHPGGKLGKAFIRVSDLMHTGTEVPLVKKEMLMSEALLAIAGKRFGCAAVVDNNGKLVGIVTDGDLRRHMQPNLLTMKVEEVMTKNPLTTRAQTLAAEVLGIMNGKRITSMFIAEDEKPVGIIHIHDVLRAGVA
jgi:arabinose-5-phosphate isomerase